MDWLIIRRDQELRQAVAKTKFQDPEKDVKAWALLPPVTNPATKVPSSRQPPTHQLLLKNMMALESGIATDSAEHRYTVPRCKHQVLS